MIISLMTLAVVGILLSAYALYVDRKIDRKADYKAVCDINDRVSCSRAFKSQYGKTLGVSNSVLGLIFYVVVFVLAYLDLIYVFYLSIASVLFSAYLVYVLYFKLKDFCLVCNALYLVNILLLTFSYIEFF